MIIMINEKHVPKIGNLILREQKNVSHCNDKDVIII